MQSKQKYYSAPIPHPSIPGAYHASFGFSGASNQYVMTSHGNRQIFANLELAELHGFRAMMLFLNKDQGTKDKRSPKKARILPSSQSAEHVFSNFGKKDK